MPQLKHWSHTILGALTILLIIAACGSSPAAPAAAPTMPSVAVTLKVSGSGTTSTLIDALKPRFEADVPGYRLEILQGSDTGAGVQGVLKGVLDVAAMARAPQNEETNQVEYVEFGQSGVAVFTHPAVGITSLTSKQIAAIFSGTITNWSAVGGPDLPLILYVRDEGESSTKALRKAFLGDTAFPEAAAHLMTSQTDMIVAVAGTPGSIGFGNWPAVLAKGGKVQPIALDGIGVDAPAYPVVVPLGISYLANRSADVRPLVDWLRSEKGQAALHQFAVIMK